MRAAPGANSLVGRCGPRAGPYRTTLSEATAFNLQRQSQSRLAAAPASPIGECEGTAVCFCDLAAQGEADAAAVRLGGEERDEEVRCIGQAGPFIAHPHRDLAVVPGPADGYPSAGLERCID